MNKSYYAHSENGRDEKHDLSKHLHQTANYTESFACKNNYKAIFKITGLLHDLGKYQPDFQEYLDVGGVRGSVPHASWGAGYARLQSLLESSVVIDGHHKGLPDKSAWKSDTEPFKRREVAGYDEIINTFLNDADVPESDIQQSETLAFTETQREAFIRCLFSALTDSDWLSTEEHFDEDKFKKRIGGALNIDLLIDKLDGEFLKKSIDGEINAMRNHSRDQTIHQADMPCGFYSLALPTGMGKTLTSLAWALRHAKKNDLKRIIIVLPYINIIDQTAQTLKDIFGEEWVLEHHSNYNEGDSEGREEAENCSPFKKRKELACENWDYSIIVTTTVQFFESLFSNRPSKCRKVHNISESVVIFDEVQTLPKDIILPTLKMLDDIHKVMNISFLFCTATQPAFEKREGFDGIDNIIPLIKDTAVLYEKSKRVEYHLLNDLNSIDNGELLEAVVENGNDALTIFNTKKAALEFYNSARDRDDWEKKYHLSTAMCPANRKDVINNIRNDLKVKKKILVVSTQLIEAGVDFDFSVVFRAIAPLESIIQSAGRCNREGKLGEMGGNVFIFKLQDSSMPDKTYAACAGHAEELIKHDISRLHDHRIFNEYYAQVIKLYVDPDRFNINEVRKKYMFKTVNDSYRIIQNTAEGLYVYNYSNEMGRASCRERV